MIDPQVLLSAVEHHQAGRNAEADAGYRECLAQEPGNAAMWNSSPCWPSIGATGRP